MRTSIMNPMHQKRNLLNLVTAIYFTSNMQLYLDIFVGSDAMVPQSMLEGSQKKICSHDAIAHKMTATIQLW